jgi:hypothetical protein
MKRQRRFEPQTKPERHGQASPIKRDRICARLSLLLAVACASPRAPHSAGVLVSPPIGSARPAPPMSVEEALAELRSARSAWNADHSAELDARFERASGALRARGIVGQFVAFSATG